MNYLIKLENFHELYSQPEMGLMATISIIVL